MSDAALTDSTTPHSWPCLNVLPTAGILDKDQVTEQILRMVSDADAHVPSPSGLIHSWVSVYLRSAGTVIVKSFVRQGSD